MSTSHMSTSVTFAIFFFLKGLYCLSDQKRVEILWLTVGFVVNVICSPSFRKKKQTLKMNFFCFDEF